MLNEKKILIEGPAGKIEVAINENSENQKNAWGIVCHPHSLHGGTMNNKVVTTLAKTFQALKLNVIRFNFRGVAQSEGEFDKGKGELQDLYAVMDWLKRQGVESLPYLAGFSFGAFVAAKAASQQSFPLLITVAPPVLHFVMHTLSPIDSPWILVQGLLDEVVPAEDVLNWAKHRKPAPMILEFKEATHFFHGQLTVLQQRLLQAIQSVKSQDGKKTEDLP